jgi:hypothetical protein
MLRSFFIPILIISAIGIPMLYSHHQSSMQETSPFSNSGPFQPSSYDGSGNFIPQVDYGSQPYPWSTNPAGPTYPNSSYSADVRPSDQLNRNNNPNQPSQRFGGAAYPSSGPQVNPRTTLPTTTSFPPTQLPTNPNNVLPNLSSQSQSSTPTQIISRPTVFTSSANSIPIADSSGVVDVIRPGSEVAVAPFVGPPIAPALPDYGRAETLIFSGDANGPDLTSQPTNFIPITDLNELFRFNIDRNWVKNRWDRVSTCPGDQGLHGLRVPVVTGTNSWDLHGSLTYFFDNNHRIQRITYRGWTGDETRLLQILQQKFGFKAQPTHWAGFYLAQPQANTAKSGLLMQHPTVIRKDNPVQQMALILEINNPQSKLTLSEEFHSLTPAAQVQ